MISIYNKYSFSKKLLVIFSALIFVLPTYLSIVGVTFINIFYFAFLIVINGKIYAKARLEKIILSIVLLLTYINLHLLTNSSYDGLYKTVMINLLLFLCILLSISIKEVDSFLKYTSIIISFCGFFILSGILFNDYSIDTNNRLSFGIINPIWLGRFAGMAILILSYLESFRFRKVFYLINIIVIILSGSKGPIVGLLLVFFLHDKKVIKVVFNLVLIVIILVVFFNFIGDDFKTFVTSRFLSFNPNATELFQEIEDDRISIFSRSINNYQEGVKLSTFFYGLGPNSSSYYYYKFVLNERWYPHNIFLEILFEYGFLALITFMFTLFKTQIWKKSMLNSLILFFLINSFFSGDLPLNWLLFLFISLKLLR